MNTRSFFNWKSLLILAGLPFVAAWLAGEPSTASGGDTVSAGASTDTLAAADADTLPAIALTNSAQPSPATLPAGMQLYPGTQEVVKMAQAGISDDVMLAYVTNSNARFGVSSDQIIYLNDLGVSGAVVTAMMQHDTAASTTAANLLPPAPLTPATAPPPAMDYTNPPTSVADDSGMGYPPAQPSDNQDYNDYAGPAPGDYNGTDDTGYFYNSLQPYGSWVYVAGSGLCWQPTVCLRDHAWRPYFDRGRWLYSDCGWYWQSDYSWGWAAFHYGRWFRDDHQGWMWRPNRVWGPAWVAWRQNRDYCGWAPLPPSAVFIPGTGFRFHDRAVGASFGFGLSSGLFAFIPIERIGDSAPSRYVVSPWDRERVFNDSHALNSLATIQNHRVANLGIDPRIVDQRSGVRVRRATIQVTAGADANGRVQADHLGRHDGSLVIFRPQLPSATVWRGTRPAVGAAGMSTPRTAFGAQPAAISARTQTVTAPGGMPTPSAASGGNFSHIQVYHPTHEEPRPANGVSWYTPSAAPNTPVRATSAGTYPPNSMVLVGQRNVSNPQWNSTQPGTHVYMVQPGSSAGYSVTRGTPNGDASQTTRSSRVTGGSSAGYYQYNGGSYYRAPVMAEAAPAPGAGTYSGQGYGARQSGYGSASQDSSYRAAPQSRGNYSGPVPQQNYSAPTPRENYSAPAPRQSYSAPASRQNYSAPASSYSSRSPSSSGSSSSSSSSSQSGQSRGH
jgi:hypothetical protein